MSDRLCRPKVARGDVHLRSVPTLKRACYGGVLREKVSLIFVFAFLAVSTLRAADVTPLERIAAKLHADRIHADHIIVLDLSGSMEFESKSGSTHKAPVGQRRIDTVLTALPGIFNAFLPGDYVVVTGFNEKLVEDPSLLIQRWEGSKSSGDLERAIRSLASRFGKSTDLGLATEGAKMYVERPDHNPIQFVYFLTDGVHEPPQDSKYLSPDAPAWQSAARDWEGLTRSPDHAIFSYLFGLYDVADAGVVQRVIPSIHFLRFHGSGDLKAFFVNEMNQAMHRRVEMLLQRQSRIGDWTPSVKEDKNGMNLAVQSSFPDLDFSGTFKILFDDGGFEQSASLTIPARGTGAIALRTVSKKGNDSFFSIRRCADRTIPLKVEWQNAGWEPQSDFDSAGLASFRGLTLSSRTVALPVHECHGRWPAYMLSVPILFILLVGAVTFIYIPKQISGRVKWLRHPAGQLPEQSFAGRGKITIGSEAGCNVRNEKLPRLLGVIRSLPGFSAHLIFVVQTQGVSIDNRKQAEGSEFPLAGFCEVEWNGLRFRISFD